MKFPWLSGKTFPDEEISSFLSFSKRAAEDEKTETVLERALGKSKAFFDPGVDEYGRGKTEVGTRTTENIR